MTPPPLRCEILLLFDPAACIPVPAGSFVHRVAGTPHYDGVAPVNFALIDPSQPGVRRV